MEDDSKPFLVYFLLRYLSWLLSWVEEDQVLLLPVFSQYLTEGILSIEDSSHPDGRVGILLDFTKGLSHKFKNCYLD